MVFLKLKDNKGEKNRAQIQAVLSTSFVGVIGGYVFGWSSPFILRISQDKENYNITESEASYFTVINNIGVLILIPVLFKNVLGRKPSLLLSAVPYGSSLLLKAFVKNLWLLYFARLCAGFGDALLFNAAAVYSSEVSTPQIRGTWGNAFVCFIMVGVLAINTVASYCDIRTTSFIGLGILVLFVIECSLVPETPYYLIMKGKYDQAKENLKKLRMVHNVDAEFDSIKTAVEQQMSYSTSWSDLFKNKANRRGLLISIFLRILQQFSGSLVFVSYLQFIFNKAGTNIKPEIASILYSSFQLLCYCISSCISNKFGRRISLMLSVFLSSIVLFLQSTFFYVDQEHPEIDLSMFNVVPLVLMLMYVVTTSLGAAMVPFIMVGELFAVNIKNKGICIATGAYALCILAASNIFYVLNSNFGLYTSFLFFGFCNLASGIVTYFFVPETKGKTLEEIQVELGGQ